MSDKPKGVHQYNLAELQAYLTEKGIAFAEDAKHADLKKLALEAKKNEEEQAEIAKLKQELTEKGIAFAEDATLEDLKTLVPSDTSSESETESKIPEGYVQVRNEKNRIINGLKPWRIAVIKEENLSLYLSYGCTLYTGQPAEEIEAEASNPEDAKNLPPHQRKK